jgi:uncharacterized membrane protein
MFVALGLLFAIVGLPLALGWVPRNRLYGLRIPATLADDRVWYPANARSGVDFVVLGLLLAALGAALIVARAPLETQSLIGGVPTLVGLIAITVRGFLHARRLKRELSASAR